MSYDFEQAWLAKFARCLDETAGESVREQVMAGSEALSMDSSRDEVIAWTQQAMDRLAALVPGEDERRAIMTGCACQYPKEDLADVQAVYEATGDVAIAHGMLQGRFEAFLRETLGLEEEMVQEVVGHGWGLAGVLEGDSIVATKIPKSGNLVAYLNESDPEKRRALYCHCPRVRDVLPDGDLPASYCYCGAGYYQGLWETILGQPVTVELLASVLQGDEMCRVRIDLPID
jgi:hypothetical protein